MQPVPGRDLPDAAQLAEQFYADLFYWNELDRGGHFAAFEEPALFTQELRNCFRTLR
jgi:pimeloyl-ACP methyl ester carboxylesterase